MKLVVVNQFRAQGSAPDRGCGTCTACCTVMAVPELRKPSRRACDHVSTGGCRIHDTRPGSCRAFHCVWLRGGLALSLRPDELGVMVDHFTERGTGAVHTLAFELWNGAFETPAAREMLEALARTHAVALSHRDGTWSVLTSSSTT